MARALSVAREHSMAYDGGPFGAVVVKDGAVISEGWNTVTSTNDPTAHAEINAIRSACRALNMYDLTGCVIYSTTEPCPMCLSAIYWARCDALYFGNTRDDAARIGFDDAFIYEELARSAAQRKLHITSGVLADEVNGLFMDWQALPDKQMY